MGLFQFITEGFTLHSGGRSNFKIECDALTNDDIECLAWMIRKLVPNFKEVYGVPRGGLRLEKVLKKYEKGAGPILIVDDVYTTGNSMREFTREVVLRKYDETSQPLRFIVLFARTKTPEWIIPLFQLWGEIE